MSVPLCFDSESQFNAWSSAAMRSKPGDSSYCTDCTPPYQRLMVEQGKCGHPQTQFIINSEGGYEGLRPEHERVTEEDA